MVNTTPQYMPQDIHPASTKSEHPMRRPFQPRNVNAPSASSETKMSKPQPNPLKSRVDVQGKPIMLSENSPAWSSVLKETRTLSLDSESDVVSQSSIFRRRTTTTSDRDENDGDMFALKRANPVYESDDEDYFASPSKRQRATEQSILHWDEQC